MELCIDGVWRILCQEGVDITDVKVMCRQLGFTSLSKDHSRALLIIPKRRYDITKNCRVLAINLQVLVSGLVRVYCISLFVSNLLAPNFEKIIAIPLQIILSLSCYLAMPSLTGSL